MSSRLLLVLFLVPGLALAQADLTAPPMVPVNPQPAAVAPPPEPPPSAPPMVSPGTPPPPQTVPGPGYYPGQQPQSGYQYSPYGAPQRNEKPAPEIGLMVSESLFGMLTSAGVSILPYFLLFGNGALLGGGQGGDETLSSVIFVLIFSAVPLAVAQTQASLANGSRYYYSETWAPAIAGLLGEAAVLGIYYGLGWMPGSNRSLVARGDTQGGSVVWLLVGTVGLVPLLSMAAINLFKIPKYGRMSALEYKRGEGFAAGVPTPVPLIGQTREGMAYGFGVSLFSGRF